MTTLADLHSYDQHLGLRIRLRRRLLGLTQADLGQMLDVTAQQIQKYEKGENRISASMLLAVAQSLHAPVSSFYEGLEASSSDLTSEATAALQLSGAARLFERLPDGPVKAAIEQMVTALAADDLKSASD